MEKLSRVEKYKKLRESIDQNATKITPSIEPVELQKQLQNINPVNDKTEDEKHKHSHTPLRFSKEIDVNRTYDTGKETFHNEYLDDFINEVKEYNLEKGNRLSDNTQIDILMQLNPENRQRRSQHYDSIRNDSFEHKEKEEDEDVSYTQSLSNEELQAEVDKLFEEDTHDEVKEEQKEVQPEPQVQEPTIRRINPIAPINKPAVKEEHAEETKAPVLEEVQEDIAETKIVEPEKIEKALPENEDGMANTERLLEETTQIRMQMDDYEDELSHLHEKVSKSNKILNAILLILIIALIAVIGVTVYWLQQAGGLF